jgi:hypothetical protein
MLYPLHITVRDRKSKPCAGVLVDVSLADETTQRQRTGPDGTVRFELPDSRTVTLGVAGRRVVHSLGGEGARVDRIAVLHQPPLQFDANGRLAVMICCPTTGESIDTGLSVGSVTELDAGGYASNSVKCSACARVHSWSQRDAFVGGGDCPAPTPRVA